MTVKEGSRSYFGEDIEEGEISEEEEESQSQSQSVEEITELEFKPKQQRQQTEQDSSSSSTSTSRVWMGDMYKYSSNYGSGLYNFAWAQAVQNKPFNEGLVRELELANSRDDNELNKRSSSSSVSSKTNLVSDDVVIDVSSDDIGSNKVEEKEEGELEEGEIELDSEPTTTATTMEENLDNSSLESESEKNMDNCDENENEIELKDEEFEKRIISIIETLETVTMNESEISFEELCSQLQSSLDSLHLIVKQRGESAVGALVDQAFFGVQTINSVFNSFNLEEQKQKKKDILRLLTRLKRQVPALFSLEQVKEIQDAIDALVPPSVSSEVKDMEVDEQLGVSTGVKKESGILGEKPVAVEVGILGQKPVLALNPLEKGLLQATSVKPGYQSNSSSAVPEILKQGVLSGSSRGRGSFGPLLDLHGDHDVDSLPSPTREAPPPLPLYLREQKIIPSPTRESPPPLPLYLREQKIIPSPTREAPPPLPLYLREQKIIGDGNVKPVPTSKVVNRSEEVAVQPYETDALRAVSTYQQKFSRNSFHLSSLLPSPTPSEESDGGGGDLNGEVSSSSNVDSLRGASSPMPFQTVIPPNIGKSSGQGPLLARSMGQMDSAPNLNTRATLKSRDPRLRLANSEAAPSDPSNHIFLRDAAKTEPIEGFLNSRKNKIIGEILVDGQPLKRQKSDIPNWELSRDAQIARGMRWSENYNAPGVPVIDRIQPEPSMVTDPRRPENGGNLTGQRQATTSGTSSANTGGTEKVPVSGTSTTPSLPSLLKDIATNPTMLMHLIMEQQRLAADAQRSSNSLQATTSPFTSSFTPVSAPLINVASSNSSLTEQKSVEKPTVLPQTTSTNPPGEWGKIRMKPRDPRRILHNSTFSNNDSLGSEQYKLDGAPTTVSQASKDILSTRQQSEQAKTASLPSQSFAPPDIAQQFTKNLRNLADILSPQSADSVSAVTQTQSGSSQSIPVKAEKLDAGVPMIHSKDQQSRINVLPEGVTETSRPQNTTWGDVEHLFERYDDQQKAAIQRERSRRIGEQNKMFAAKKLCLVLDLDHTLLNSAKFVEVEPVHEEILRKKEEQDREKPRRHLFRFSHMGMWTKLRPGIWTFLEKASKLYELHLYTMGNKLYATEMAKVLDPTGALFAGRVISKGDDEDPFDVDDKPKSKDLEGVLGMESAVVIIDDSVKVWPHNKLNLILVERYTYFPCSRRQFGLPGPSLLEIDHDERPEDGTLASSLTVIERIHQNFFSNPSLDEVDVRNILASEQRKILAGCRILFSRIFPVGEAKPHQHPLWQTAEQFGAVCTTQIDNLVTHVVANSLGTDKVNWALSTGRYVVHPGWVEASALLYRRANENDFAVKINMA